MYKSCFRILALKCFQPTDINNVVEERIKWMQKSLYYKKDWIKLYQGVEINDPKGKTITIDSSLFDDQMLYGAPNLSVSISVIVGVNGAGKSSILDMIVRIMNNVSAAIMGENFSYSAAEHLHYVEYVYASLLLYMDGKLKMIDIKGRDITITEFLQEGQSEQYKASTPMILLSAAENPDETKPLKRNASQFKELESFFYTIVSNYSMYAYNYRDYWKEATNEDRLKAINKKYNEFNNPQEAIWLTGLFHKNDGYQAPIVLNPMRNAGIIDGPRENVLAKERLLSMLFYTDGNDDKKKGIEHYPFRLINKKLSIVGLFLPFYEDSKKWTKEWVLQRLDIKKRSRVYQNYNKISSFLIKFYTKEYALPTSFLDRKAYDYLVYKTLKIARTYKKYAKLYSNLRSIAFNEDLLLKHLIELKGDHSHITAKLRRTILYLKLEMYKNAPRMIFRLSDIDKQISKKLVEAKKIMPEATIEDLLPPPIFNIDFQIVNQHKADSYTDKDMIPFEGLSSGERQIAYTVSNVLYHLINMVHPKNAYLSKFIKGVNCKQK